MSTSHLTTLDYIVLASPVPLIVLTALIAGAWSWFEDRRR
jgi:hypothetical protein